ncbi:MAG TPA: hypothetical protein DCR40_09320 [Prolixibacteraceae bacterium]|nr:hypothetical protein [Prolixibacteraceae bacterium]
MKDYFDVSYFLFPACFGQGYFLFVFSIFFIFKGEFHSVRDNKIALIFVVPRTEGNLFQLPSAEADGKG